jgi:hypothetical protein
MQSFFVAIPHVPTFWDQISEKLADWLTAIGTIGATVTALWRGLRDRTLLLSVGAALATDDGAAKIYGDPR